MTPPTAERVRELVTYDSESGELRWTYAGPPRVRGKAVKCGTESQYVYITVDGCDFAAHQIIWLWWYGEWPSLQIDHANGDKRDNRLLNLRLATRAQQVFNRPVRAKSGYKGVIAKRGKWAASIFINRRRISLGSYASAEEAAAAYLRAAEDHYGADFVRESQNA